MPASIWSFCTPRFLSGVNIIGMIALNEIVKIAPFQGIGRQRVFDARAIVVEPYIGRFRAFGEEDHIRTDTICIKNAGWQT